MDWKKVVKDIEMKEEMKEELIRKCKRRKHVSNVMFRYSKVAAVFIGLAVCSMGSLTAYAAVSAYKARMEAMDKEEMQEHYDTELAGTGEAYRYSREMTDSEKERLSALRGEYENGRFPEGEISKEKVEDGLYYDVEPRTYMLPERELTDEEILQILDMWAKVDYSLQQINREKEAAGELETLEFEVEEVEITEENAPYIYGKAVVEKVYNIDLSDCEPEVTYTTPDYQPGSDGYYDVKFPQGEREYIVRFRVYEGELYKIPTNVYSSSLGTEPPVEGAEQELYPVEKLKEENILEKLCEESKRIVTEAIGIEEQITRTYCAYMSDEEMLDRIYVVLETESKERFELWYNPSTMKFVMLKLFGKETYEENKLFDQGGPFADIYELVEMD